MGPVGDFLETSIKVDQQNPEFCLGGLDSSKNTLQSIGLGVSRTEALDLGVRLFPK